MYYHVPSMYNQGVRTFPTHVMLLSAHFTCAVNCVMSIT